MSTKKKKQSGFMLLELSLVLILLSVISYMQLKREFDEKLDLKAKNVSKSLLIIQDGVNKALIANMGSWVSAQPGVPIIITTGSGPTAVSTTIADPFNPTVSDFKNLGVLPSNFTNNTLIGGNYKISIQKVPAGCTPPSCNLEGLIYIDSPFTVFSNKVDGARLGLAMKTIGPDGAMTTDSNPSMFFGLNAQWSMPVPAPMTPNSSLIGIRVGYGSGMFAKFFRVDGANQMEADGNFGGNSLTNVKQVLSVTKNAGDSCPAGDAGAIASGVVNSASVVMICSNGKWKVYNGPTASPGSDCTIDGISASSNVDNQQLICKNKKYVKVTNLFSTNPEVARILVRDGDVVPYPACDVGGRPDYTIIIYQVTVDMTKEPPYQAMKAITQDNGTSWTVLIKLVTDTGIEASGNDHNLAAIMHLECKY